MTMQYDFEVILLLLLPTHCREEDRVIRVQSIQHLTCKGNPRFLCPAPKDRNAYDCSKAQGMSRSAPHFILFCSNTTNTSVYLLTSNKLIWGF